MAATLIRVSSRATGTRETVRVYVYDTLEEMRAAADRFDGGVAGEGFFDDALGVTQTYERQRLVDGVWSTVRHPLIVRLQRDRIGTTIVSHEMNHAAVELYGRTLAPDTLAVDVLHNANEELAHLQSDLTAGLVRRLYALGFYE